MIKAFSIALSLLLATTCGDNTSKPVVKKNGGEENNKVTKGSAANDKAASNKQAWDSSKGSATIKGVVKFAGDTVAPKMLKLNDECKAHHPDGLESEKLIVNANGTLKNVFIRVKSGMEGWSFSVPSEPAVIDQVGCAFKPHILAVRRGQKIVYKNSDGFQHNVNPTPRRNKGYNQAVQPNEELEKDAFTILEIGMLVKCTIHEWMECRICVVANPFFSITSDDGSFKLPKLPAGKYEIEAWHEKFGKQTLSVTVGDGQTAEIEFTYK